jgi:hypothetical protein
MIAEVARNFVPSPGVELPVRVVVKSPMLALRYPKPSHDVYSNSSRIVAPAIYANMTS